MTITRCISACAGKLGTDVTDGDRGEGWEVGERTAAGLSSDPTLPGLRGLGRGRARASTDPGSDFPAAPHLLQLSLPHPPGVRCTQREGGATGRQTASDASVDICCACKNICMHHIPYWHLDLNAKYETANSKELTPSEISNLADFVNESGR